jgi:hypothetical protein
MHGLANLPKLDTAAHASTQKNHPWCIIVQQVQKHYELAEEVDHHWSSW